MANTDRSILSLKKRGDKKTPVKVKAQTAYTARRFKRRAEFLARKSQELGAKFQTRSVEKIIDSVVRVVDENEIYARLIVGLKKHVSSDNNSGSCCMSDVALYSTKTNSRRRLASGGVTARV
ncbi:hypothetical protein [Xenorhabdus griffiniae]|uniref:Uncharacterized protein n=1 Tax=Xenorhabdus griffiniae TaxID=351672 RepID=A0ABY9XEB9_9GAMM|nr:hypothetical protein [Xenorhabdus griffiniae]MBD1229119.1 hypothetical protein [Xenorhabdus griffiniae]MBE8588831.1 hypothetical protein [Xenorhabdus griffiniae]WMV71266.1 hypothetical protein QL128_13875 [Xenorhabdus griffiniae]WNH00942.1 hypothetical protein QL112_013880 [Xenorhabdus griffiniae]